MPKMNIAVGQTSDIMNPAVVSFEERQAELERIDQYEKDKAKREKNSPFSRWSQFNLEHTKELMWLAMNHAKAHAILYFLVDQMDEYNAVMCSYQVLQEVLGISYATVARSIKTLKDKGFVSVLKSGNSNVYAINDTVYWKSWGNNRKYSKFPANVVLALSEQDKDYTQQLSLDDLKFTKHKEVSKTKE